MRKTVIEDVTKKSSSFSVGFLDLEQMARVEISSESQDHPIENALLDGMSSGWQASQCGEQMIRLIFDQPQTIKHIQLIFDEQKQARTQAFVLLWRKENEANFQEILRQEYHFSPPFTSRQIEDYAVDLKQLSVLELRIIPDISGGDVHAALTRLRLSILE